MKFLVVFLIILLIVTPTLGAKYISLPYKQTLNKANLLDTLNVNFEIKDSDGKPLEGVLVIIQGISNQAFSENKLTNSDGKISFILNKNEIFIYTIYQLSYEEKIGNFFTNSDKNIGITLNKISNDKWYFYYENNGQIEVKFKSLDADINYNVNEYINNILEIKNVAGANIDLIKDKTSFKTVDSATLRELRWWGGLKPYEIFVDLTLKKDGWVKVTIKEDISEICVGNAVGRYRGQPFDVSGSEFICKTEDNKGTPGSNLVPEWILKNTYKFFIGVAYKINNQEKIFELLTQDFYIDNIEWKPEINSQPETRVKINENWNYNITPKYLNNFVYYSLKKAPSNMKIDVEKGVVNWMPANTGYYEVTVRAFYPYFHDNYKVAYNDQEFTLEVFDDTEKGNLYADSLYIFNNTINVGEEIKASFKAYNNYSVKNSFYYEIQTGDNNSLIYEIKDMEPYSKRTIYVSWKYASSGIYNSQLIIDSKHEINESNEGDNIKYFGNIVVT